MFSEGWGVFRVFYLDFINICEIACFFCCSDVSRRRVFFGSFSGVSKTLFQRNVGGGGCLKKVFLGSFFGQGVFGQGVFGQGEIAERGGQGVFGVFFFGRFGGQLGLSPHISSPQSLLPQANRAWAKDHTEKKDCLFFMQDRPPTGMGGDDGTALGPDLEALEKSDEFAEWPLHNNKMRQKLGIPMNERAYTSRFQCRGVDSELVRQFELLDIAMGAWLNLPCKERHTISVSGKRKPMWFVNLSQAVQRTPWNERIGSFLTTSKWFCLPMDEVLSTEATL